MSELVRWIGAYILLGIFALFAAGNAYYIWRIIKYEDSSFAPLYGGLLGCIGILIMPFGTLFERALYCWIPLVVDIGCVPYTAGFVIQEVRRAWNYRENNCIKRLAGESDDKHVDIKFYKGGRLIFEETFKMPKRFGNFSSDGIWQKSEAGNGYLLNIWDASILIEEKSGYWKVSQERGWFSEELCIFPIILSARPKKLAAEFRR